MERQTKQWGPVTLWICRFCRFEGSPADVIKHEVSRHQQKQQTDAAIARVQSVPAEAFEPPVQDSPVGPSPASSGVTETPNE